MVEPASPTYCSAKDPLGDDVMPWFKITLPSVKKNDCCAPGLESVHLARTVWNPLAEVTVTDSIARLAPRIGILAYHRVGPRLAAATSPSIVSAQRWPNSFAASSTSLSGIAITS